MHDSPELREALRNRARVISAIRSFFAQRDFVEVETPALSPAADPALHLDSFESELRLTDGRRLALYLPTSPEHHMKRMLAGGMERIFQICKFFRNGEVTGQHNPEFTGLEWYQAHTSMQDAMTQTEELVHQTARQALSRTSVSRSGRELSLVPPYRRMTVRQALEELAGVRVPERWEEEKLRRALSRAGIQVADDDGFDDLVHRALLERVEPALEQMGPVFLHDYPAPMASQARLRRERPWEAERFELYIGGLELCNGYGELTDADKLRERFQHQLSERRRLGKPVPPMDQPYLGALERGLPDCSGCALGVDRLLMLLLDKPDISLVMAFPLSLELKDKK